MRKSLYLFFFMLPLLMSSCWKDEEEIVLDNHCYISSVALGTIKRAIHTTDKEGNDSIYYTTFTASSYKMSIDQKNLLIENRDSILYGAVASSVLTTITYEGATLHWRPADDPNSEWILYNSSDSLDLRKPLHLLVYANDAQSYRQYTLRLNVHQQEGDSLYWNHVDEETTVFAEMKEMRAFMNKGTLKVLGQISDGIQTAVRSGLASAGEWTLNATNLPKTTIVSTLHQQGDNLFVSSTEGAIYTSQDAITWEQLGPVIPNRTLVAVSSNFYYVLIDGLLYSSSNVIDWKVESLDSSPEYLPDNLIYSSVYDQENGNHRILICGNRDVETDTTAVVWSKVWYDDMTEGEAEWTYYTQTSENPYSCPRLQYLTIIPYDGKMIAIGGAPVNGGTHKAMDHLYFSKDHGVTWKADRELHLPYELSGVSGPLTATVDENNFIWIIANQQVWRGRLNRLGFVRQ